LRCRDKATGRRPAANRRGAIHGRVVETCGGAIRRTKRPFLRRRTNEVTKGRELNRELNAGAGQTVPDELQQRVWKHVNLVAKLKADCEQNREQAALKK
jgi:hypothetical protein